MSSLSSGQTCGHSPCPGLPKPPSQEVCCLIRIWAKATVSREEPPGLGHLVAGTSGDVGEEEVLKPGLSPVGCVGVGPLGTWVGGALEQAPPHGLLSREPCSPAIAPGTSQALTGSWPPQAPSEAPRRLHQALPCPLQPLILVPIPLALSMSDIVACSLDSEIPFRPSSTLLPHPCPTTLLVSSPSYPLHGGAPWGAGTTPQGLGISVTPRPRNVPKPLHLPSPDSASI